MLHAPERGIPTTYDLAITELIRSRRCLTSARESLEIAVGIFRQLTGDADPGQTAVLETIIGDLEEAEARLRSTGA